MRGRGLRLEKLRERLLEVFPVVNGNQGFLKKIWSYQNSILMLRIGP
jgi:hypothetical protein